MTKIIEDIALDFNDVLIQPRPSTLTSRKDVDLNVQYKTKSGHIIHGIPIISANMSAVSTFDMAKALASHGLFCALHKHYSSREIYDFFNNDQNLRDKVFVTIGMKDFLKLEELRTLVCEPRLIQIDVANGYMYDFASYVEKVRICYPNSIIMAGNVVTAEGASMLISAGADIIKVGIGSGSVCHTRLVAGVGIPQLSAILDTIDEVNKKDALLCSDGGIVTAGDFSKAFVAGAHFVMAGGIFSGHDECNMMKFTDETGRTFMEYYGMSSEHAMNKHNGGMNSYRASEGKLVRVPYKGSVNSTIEHILGGIRSAGTYIGSSSLQTYAYYAKLRRVHATHNKVFGE
jgi:GMP reductase